EAEWIARPSAEPVMTSGQADWRRIVEPAGLARWQDAWRRDGAPGDLFGAGILDHDWGAVLAAEGGDQVVAGAIVTCGPWVAGISSFCACPGDGPEPWPGCLAVASSLFPGRALVGYESGDELIRAERHGFERIGRLRVWINDTSPPA